MFWSAVAGASVSLIAIPLRAMYDVSRYALSFSLYGLIFFIGLPIISVMALSRINLDRIPFFILSVLAVPFSMIAVGAMATAYAVELLILAPFYLIRDMGKGFYLSCKEGWAGFQRVWDSPSYFGERADTYFSRAPNVNPQGINLQLFGIATPRPATDFDNLQGQLPTVDELSEAETAHINTLLNTHSSPAPNSPLRQLKDLYGQYKNLYDKIQLVKTAINAGDVSEVEDDFGGADGMQNPILFTKEYLASENHWLPVPAYTHITDREFLKTWLLGTQTRAPGGHPRTREDVFNPNADPQGRRTRYRIYPLTQTYCSAPELAEGAKQIRLLLANVASTLTDAVSPAAPVTVAHTRQTLFSVNANNNDSVIEEPSDEERASSPYQRNHG